MDYLIYVEHQAEDLQFFLWYYNYIPRWSALMPRQKALSPAWEPGRAKGPKFRFISYRHKRARSDRMNKILSILDMESEKQQKEESPFKCPPIKTSFSPDDDFAQPGTPPLQDSSPVEPPKPDWCKHLKGQIFL